MKRPPSYSDSFIVLHTDSHLEPLFAKPAPVAPIAIEPLEIPGKTNYCKELTLFIFKGSLHVLFISAFETSFYFLYVNKSEDSGIIDSIDTYYSPIIHDCSTKWKNATRWLVKEILTYEVNQTTIDIAGNNALLQRQSYNTSLLLLASSYSAISFIICISIVTCVRYNRWSVSWLTIFSENILFITILAAYEFFFFETIIYKYLTISTPELNQYIVDGLAQCAA